MPDLELPDLLNREIPHVEIPAKLELYVRGIEVTQAIQYSRAHDHLTDPADRGPDNSVQLVVGKPAWVRVYVRSLFSLAGVTGTLEVQRRSSGIFWFTVTTLNAQPPGTVMASWNPAYATERGTLGATLNFIIPADEMIGTLRLIARVSAGGRTDAFSTDVVVTLQQTLRLAGIMVAYNGPANGAPGAPNINLAAPTVAQMQATAAWTLTTFPVESNANFRAAGTLTWNQPLTGPATAVGGCSQGWLNLNAAVANQRIADGNQAGWVYYGVLPAGVPMGPVVGCESSGVSSGTVDGGFGAQITMAHEIGHGCGLAHAPCGGVGASADPNYPAYEPYDTPGAQVASTGEWGLNINNGNLMSPQIFRDVMSYCGTNWISLYHYQRLINNNRLNPTTVGVDAPWWADLVWEEIQKFPKIPLPDPPPFEPFLPMYPPPHAPADLISIIGTFTREGRIEVSRVARTRARPEVEGAEPTVMVARLLGEGGGVLAEAPVLRLISHGCGSCGCDGKRHELAPPYLVQALIPDVAPGTALEIRDRDKVLWERTAPSAPVQVVKLEVSVSGEDLMASWQVRGEVVEGWLRWSKDGGETWQALATGLIGNSAVVQRVSLPPGGVLIQFVAHDGFFSASSTPVAVEVPGRGPDVAILHPHQGHTYLVGQTIHLWCAATRADGSTVESKHCVWNVDGKEVGRGRELWIAAPRAGEHVVTLSAGDEHGTSEAKTTFKTEAPPKPPRSRRG